jgi:hypothetical protein
MTSWSLRLHETAVAAAKELKGVSFTSTVALVALLSLLTNF